MTMASRMHINSIVLEKNRASEYINEITLYNIV